MLASAGHTAFRINSGAFRVGNRFIRSAPVGWPDITLIVEGRIVGIEVKAAGGKQSDGQKKIQMQFSYAGAQYWLVYSAEEVRLLLNKFLEELHAQGRGRPVQE
jgi:hypothetical protein